MEIQVKFLNKNPLMQATVSAFRMILFEPLHIYSQAPMYSLTLVYFGVLATMRMRMLKVERLSFSHVVTLGKWRMLV